MAVNTETAIAWMAARQGKVTYSMDYRDGPNSYDCSSAIYYALMSAGAITAGWAVNTEYMHDWLIKNGYVLIAENQDWTAQRGDIFIWGRKGQSSGAGGHTGIFIDANNIIHCNFANNSITVNNYDQTAAAAGWMYSYVYRLKNKPQKAPSGKSIETLVKETLLGEYGNGDERKRALGNQYEAVMAIINGKAKTTKKTVEELAREVIAGKHGNGEERKKSLGSNYDAVQKRVTEILKGDTTPEAIKHTPVASKNNVVESIKESKTIQNKPVIESTATKEDGDLSFNGVILKKSVLNKILENCKKHNILPSYAITVLHFEGLWGSSNVAKIDNNWGGMTMTSDAESIVRPSGVTVTRGTARPASEGKCYMHYANVDDFLTDWFYLLRANGSYKVSGAKTFSESVKGMFKVGGATYDYAATGYDNYLVGMASRLKAIENENGQLTKYDLIPDTPSNLQPDKIDINIEGIYITINGVDYTLTKKPV